MNKYSMLKEEVLTLDETFIMYIIEEVREITLTEVLIELKGVNNIKGVLQSLENKSLINIDYNKGIITCVKEDENINVLTIDVVDEVRVILNREIKSYELEKLKKWILVYPKDKIKDALYKTQIKGIDNFNYVEKVLENSLDLINDEVTKSPSKIVKKFDLFN